MIPQEIIDEVRERSDIVEIASQYLRLKKTGKNYKALCPFHTEKTPSFVISPERQIFHCFGCGAGGNAFNLVMKLENMDFVSALKALAQKVGVKIPQSFSPEEARGIKERKKLYEINEVAAKFYEQVLKKGGEGKKAYKYLRERKLKEETINKFRLGYAPDSWDSLLKNFKTKGISLELAERVKLISPSREGEGYYDYFRKRIIFPIFDLKGRVVAFGGRVLGESLPKYLNSPETSLFNKGNLLYGLNFVQSEIRSLDQAIIVEGYMDVLTAQQEGLPNVVASLGTSLTPGQAGLLSRYTNQVIIAYDPDTAGEIATLRGFDLLLERGMKVKVLSLPEGEDPDKFIREKGKKEFSKNLTSSLSLLDYRFHLVFSHSDASSVEGKVKIVEELLPTLARISNSIEQKAWVKKLSERLKVEEVLILRDLAKVGQGKLLSLAEEISLPSVSELAEENLIQLMLESPEIVPQVREGLKEEHFRNSDYRKIIKIIFGLEEKGESAEAKKIMDLGEENLASLISQLSLKRLEGDRDKMIRDCIEKIKKENLKRKMERLQEEIKTAEREGKVEELKDLLSRYQELAGGAIR
jgi:DNA primase